jgi:UDP-N-acetylmuramate dehydrogenase
VHFSWEGNTVEVAGGVLLNRLVKEVVAKGFAGIEDLAGIPGTVGGAVIMNAGAFSSCIADTLLDIECFRPAGGTVERLNAEDLELGYRTSSLKVSGDIVLSARFTFDRTQAVEALEHRRREILDRRRQKQPLDLPNCGSVFKRPTGNYAGALIEKAGLKGRTYGGARISEKHANFIVNTGGAKADEVRHLIVTAQKVVHERFSVLLEPEVIFMGEFTEPLFRIPQEIA